MHPLCTHKCIQVPNVPKYSMYPCTQVYPYTHIAKCCQVPKYSYTQVPKCTQIYPNVSKMYSKCTQHVPKMYPKCTKMYPCNHPKCTQVPKSTIVLMYSMYTIYQGTHALKCTHVHKYQKLPKYSCPQVLNIPKFSMYRSTQCIQVPKYIQVPFPRLLSRII
jgi:hypothetical protein